MARPRTAAIEVATSSCRPCRWADRSAAHASTISTTTAVTSPTLAAANPESPATRRFDALPDTPRYAGFVRTRRVLFLVPRAAHRKVRPLTEPQPGPATHKFAVVLNKKIPPAAALNACAHMTATLVARADDETRRHMSFVDYTDADGNAH